MIIKPSPHLPPARVWVRPGRVPSKATGRVGTRRAWKRKHPPRWVIDPTRTMSFMHNGVLYVSPDAFERLKDACGPRQKRMVVPGRHVGREAEALRHLGLPPDLLKVPAGPSFSDRLSGLDAMIDGPIRYFR